MLLFSDKCDCIPSSCCRQTPQHMSACGVAIPTSLLTACVFLTSCRRCVLQRGLAPRVFQYLFQEIDKAQDENVSRQSQIDWLQQSA